MAARDVESLRSELRALADERLQGRRFAPDLLDRLAPVVRDAHAAGVSVTQIARDTSLDQPMLLAMIEQRGRW